MVNVIAKKDESFESLLRRFRKKVIDERVVSTCRERSYFTSASQKRRLYEKEIKKKIRKANARREAEMFRELQP
jgi:ribosomal protein S21